MRTDKNYVTNDECARKKVPLIASSKLVVTTKLHNAKEVNTLFIKDSFSATQHNTNNEENLKYEEIGLANDPVYNTIRCQTSKHTSERQKAGFSILQGYDVGYQRQEEGSKCNKRRKGGRTHIGFRRLFRVFVQKNNLQSAWLGKNTAI